MGRGGGGRGGGRGVGPGRSAHGRPQAPNAGAGAGSRGRLHWELKNVKQRLAEAQDSLAKADRGCGPSPSLLAPHACSLTRPWSPGPSRRPAKGASPGPGPCSACPPSPRGTKAASPRPLSDSCRRQCDPGVPPCVAGPCPVCSEKPEGATECTNASAVGAGVVEAVQLLRQENTDVLRMDAAEMVREIEDLRVRAPLWGPGREGGARVCCGLPAPGSLHSWPGVPKCEATLAVHRLTLHCPWVRAVPPAAAGGEPEAPEQAPAHRQARPRGLVQGLTGTARGCRRAGARGSGGPLTATLSLSPELSRARGLCLGPRALCGVVGLCSWFLLL